ncbi:protein phosphatase 1 regulatory subunit 32 [Centropristis striata]|uniref:protein phosphatase 1 regulatory subunit 32 n=1 Tax=Centropristis striata TaxID=184440 RepID=UPI0027DF8D00|nr:protein phosphatase 1 regulatory subunit 32 [Centropristis striata]
MAEQRRIVMPTARATGSRGRLTGDTVKLNNKTYVPGKVNFTSYLGYSSGSGFTSNQRPAIYYRPSKDHIDNPQFGLLLADSFTSQTKQDYQPHIRSHFSGSLPNVINKPRDIGYLQLRTRQKTDPVEDKTEYRNSYVPHHLTPAVSQHHVTVGPRRESGFTEGADLQLNTFQEKEICMVQPQQTPSSVMKNDFTAPSYLQDTEARPNMCNSNFSRETGFTRGAIAPLACPTSLLPSLQTKSNAPIEKTIGKKEPTGYLLNTSNNQAFPNTPFHFSHFNTHYKSTFCNQFDYEKLNSGPSCPRIISGKMDSGYNRRDMDRLIFRG